jgi:hypothetical protein
VLCGLLGTLTGCGGGSVKVAQPAVRGVANALDTAAVEVVLSTDDISRLGTRANVGDEVVRAAAEGAATEPLWSRSVTKVRAFDEAINNVARDTVVDTACDLLAGEPFTWQAFFTKLANNGVSVNESEAQSLASDLEDFYNDMYDARYGDDPQRRVSVLVFCLTADQLTP